MRNSGYGRVVLAVRLRGAKLQHTRAARECRGVRTNGGGERTHNPGFLRNERSCCYGPGLFIQKIRMKTAGNGRQKMRKVIPGSGDEELPKRGSNVAETGENVTGLIENLIGFSQNLATGRCLSCD